MPWPTSGIWAVASLSLLVIIVRDRDSYDQAGGSL